MIVSFFIGLMLGASGTIITLHVVKRVTNHKADQRKKTNANDINFLDAKFKKVI